MLYVSQSLLYILNRIAFINPNEIIRDTWQDWTYYGKMIQNINLHYSTYCPLISGPLGKLWYSQNIIWLISCAYTVQPMNLAWKRQHEELTSWSSRPSTKYFFPYRTQFQIIGPHRQASWANRRVGPPVSVSLVAPFPLLSPHGLMSYIDTKAKCRHLKNWPGRELLCWCLSVWYPLLHTVTHSMRHVLIYTEKGEREGKREPERRLKGQQLTNVSPVYKLW